MILKEDHTMRERFKDLDTVSERIYTIMSKVTWVVYLDYITDLGGFFSGRYRYSVVLI